MGHNHTLEFLTLTVPGPMEITCEGVVTIRLTDKNTTVTFTDPPVKVERQVPLPPTTGARGRTAGLTAASRTTTGTCPHHGAFKLVERYDCEAGRWERADE
jgi:hypothetical protein